MITARITLPFEECLESFLASERFQHPRASYTTRREGKHLTIDIEARDATALKTAVNSLVRILVVHEKAKNV